MESAFTAVAMAWVLGCGTVMVIVAALAIAPPGRPRLRLSDAGPALVWTWLTVAVLVPPASALHAFNWATAPLAAVTAPAAWWIYNRRRAPRPAFTEAVRSAVMRALGWRSRGPAPSAGTLIRAGAAVAWVIVVMLMARPGDVRLRVPADYDTLAHARLLFEGGNPWDPLAALVAVLARLSSTGTLLVFDAVRAGLIALTGLGVGEIVAIRRGRGLSSALASVGMVAGAPWLPAASWAIAALTMVATVSVLRYAKERGARDCVHAAAALALAGAHAAACAAGSDLLWRARPAPLYLEHAAATREVMKIARRATDGDWMLVGFPEQHLEIDGRGRFLDLARFVPVLRARAMDPQFRFDFGVSRLFVLVEKTPAGSGEFDADVRFLADQPAAYRVPRERARLSREAGAICERVRRARGGVSVVYDDELVRIYRVET